MDDQLAIQHLLRTHLLTAQSKNPRYSLRSYSRKLDIQAGALSAILNGKRNVSKTMAEKITRKLLTDPQKRADVLKLFPEKKYRTTNEMLNDKGVSYLEIEASSFRMIAEWEHFAVLSLIKTKDFKNDSKWIGKRLGISSERAEDVIQTLVTVGFLEEVNGELKRIPANIRSSDDTINLSVKQSHVENFEIARQSLFNDDIDKRDFTSITMAVDPEKMKTAKEMIRKFQDDLSEIMGAGDQSEVYRMSIQLFPLTRTKETLQ